MLEEPALMVRMAGVTWALPCVGSACGSGLPAAMTKRRIAAGRPLPQGCHFAAFRLACAISSAMAQEAARVSAVSARLVSTMGTRAPTTTPVIRASASASISRPNVTQPIPIALTRRSVWPSCRYPSVMEGKRDMARPALGRCRAIGEEGGPSSHFRPLGRSGGGDGGGAGGANARAQAGPSSRAAGGGRNNDRHFTGGRRDSHIQ